MDDRIYDEPSRTDATDGNVSVEGPDGVSVRMTPAAASETSDRLLESALTAQGQRVKARSEGGSNGSATEVTSAD